MSTTTPINGIFLPQLADAPNIETATQGISTIDGLVVSRFSTTAARDTAITAPVAGMQSYVSGTGELYLYNGTKWVSSRPRLVVKAADEPVTSSVAVQADDHLVLSVEASSLYRGRMCINYDAAVAGDLRLSVKGPPSSTITTTWMMLESGATTQRDLINGSDTTQGEYVAGGLGAGIIVNAWLDINVNVAGTSGVVALYWAQGTSSATTTHVFNGSLFELWKV